MTRRLYIDWLRGVAVLFMISWHSIDAWSVTTGRDSAPFAAVLFIAGWAAPLFLFLAGVSIPLAANSRMARGSDRAEASWALQKRAWQVFLIAHLFRFQSFVLNPTAHWDSLLDPDILNILGLGLAAAAYCWGRGHSRRARSVWFLAPLLAVLILTPWSRHWWWPTLMPPWMEAYIRPVRDHGVFSLFPWVGYVFAGAFLGELIAERAPDDVALYRNIGLIGAALLIVGAIGIAVPLPWATPWADSIPLFICRAGTMSLALAVSWVLLRGRSPRQWSPLIVFGRTSLFVYWVHVELAYGVFGYPLRHRLTLPWAVVACGLLTLLMLGCAELWLRRPVGQPMIPEAHARGVTGEISGGRGFSPGRSVGPEGPTSEDLGVLADYFGINTLVTTSITPLDCVTS